MECTGCVFDKGVCILQENLSEYDCPCQICLVKSMCSGVCKDFSDYHAKVILKSLHKSTRGIAS